MKKFLLKGRLSTSHIISTSIIAVTSDFPPPLRRALFPKSQGKDWQFFLHGLELDANFDPECASHVILLLCIYLDGFDDLFKIVLVFYFSLKLSLVHHYMKG